VGRERFEEEESGMRLIMTLALGLVLIGQSTTASAAAASEENTPVEVGLGVGSVLGTVVYAPFKTVFCILGGISSVGTLIFDPKMAGRVADTACRGTWVITPNNLKGREPVKFVGDTAGR